ncbi:MAG: S41 family peptidase [Planctomycetota bacterium]
MKTPSLLCLAGLCVWSSCVQPEPKPDSLEPLDIPFAPFGDYPWMHLRFHNEDATAFDESWVFGEVTGVTPDLYDVRLDRTTSTTPGGSLRFEGEPDSAYHTMWQELILPEEGAAYMVELRWDQLLEDDSVMPLVWVRLDGEEGMIGMTDSRSLAKTTAGVWESCTLQVAVPIEATVANVGVGMMGQGVVRFDHLRMRSGWVGEPVPASEEARAYVDTFLEIVEAEAMMRDNVDWVQMHKDMTSLIQRAGTPADTYPALQFCLEALGDHHSRLLTPAFQASRGGGEEKEKSAESEPPQYLLPVQERLDGDLGYLWLPGHLTFGEEGPRVYASTLARALEDLQDCKGFVIDLRQNGGGNMWPMLAGLGPLLGTEVVGGFQYPEGTQDTWWYRDGVSGQADIPCTEVVPPHGASFAQDIPIAILTSRRTGSSGEATLVSFLGRPNVRTFGQATTGLSTGNSSIPLSDGAMLLLTTSVYADRNGKQYGGVIEPDVAVPAHVEGEEDAALQQAVDWLLQ